MGPYCYSVCYFIIGVLPQTKPVPHDAPIVNTLTGPDLYTGLQWQIPFGGSVKFPLFVIGRLVS